MEDHLQPELSSDDDEVDGSSKSSDSNSGSPADKIELFQTLKFSSDVLEEMNSKRRSIVGGGGVSRTVELSSSSFKGENLDRVRSQVKKGMANVGNGALPPANSVSR